MCKCNVHNCIGIRISIRQSGKDNFTWVVGLGLWRVDWGSWGVYANTCLLGTLVTAVATENSVIISLMLSRNIAPNPGERAGEAVLTDWNGVHGSCQKSYGGEQKRCKVMAELGPSDTYIELPIMLHPPNSLSLLVHV